MSREHCLSGNICSLARSSFAHYAVKVRTGYSYRYTLGMNAEQWQWLLDAANRIPELFGAIEQGNIRADANLGERVINGKSRTALLCCRGSGRWA